MTPRRTRAGIGLAVLLLIVVEVVIGLRYRPPSAAPLDHPPELFSAARAARMLERVLGDGSPHPVGSIENARVREALEHELREIGLQPELQSGPTCSRFGTCAHAENVIARIPGRESGPALLLSAHYDSVPASAGAADDGSGVATLLEVGRSLRVHPPERPMILLFADGEELGLLGAELFVRRERAPIRAAINVEARGTSGPSLLFETRGGSLRFAPAIARALDRPVTSSLSGGVYRRLPNDTDLTVLSRHGIPGVNFGFIAGVPHYHTPLDDLAHLDRGSLQHHGNNVLSLARALDGEPHEATPGEAVWVDVLGSFVIWWRLEHTWLLVAAAFVLLAAATIVQGRRQPLPVIDVVRALFVLPALVAASGLLALVLELGLRSLDAIPAPWIAQPLFVIGAAVSASVAALLGATLISVRPIDPRAGYAAIWLSWFVLAAGLASNVPEASHLALLPALAAGAFAFVPPAAVLASFAVVIVLWLPIVHLLYDAIGFFTVMPYPLAVAVALSPLVPLLLLIRLRVRLLAAAIALAVMGLSMTAAALSAPFSADAPQRLTFALHWDASSSSGRWLVDAPFGAVPDAVMNAAGFARSRESAHPFLGSMNDRVHAAPASLAPLPPPELEEIENTTRGTRRYLRARLRSPRAADVVALSFDATSSASVRFEGLTAHPRWVSGRKVYIWGGRQAPIVEIETSAPGGEEVVLIDHARGLPPAGRFLLDARPASAVASQLGDVTVVSRRTRL